MGLLLSSYELRSVRLRNRLIASPLEKNLSDRSGAPTERYVSYVRSRAKGGVALIVPEASYIHPIGRGSAYQLGVHNDALITALSRLVEAAHSEGAAIAMQINFSSRQTTSAVTGSQPWSASGVPCGALADPEPLHVMTLDDIEWVKRQFADAARRVRKARFDAVILHGAHGYLLSEFFSPISNQRDDIYGGSIENRARLALETVRAVRKAVGDDFVVGYRLSADECTPGGFSVEDSIYLSREIERAGVDLIDVSMGAYESGARLTPFADSPVAPNAEIAARIRKAVSIPISVVGRIVDPDVAESVLAAGASDFVTVGRALHADPDFVRKGSGQNHVPQRPCVSCMVCIDCRNENIPAICSVNPWSGRYATVRGEGSSGRKRIVIVGGGLAGLQAAERAAEQGFDVVLFEAGDRLGGQLLWAARLPFLTDFGKIVEYFERRLPALSVDLRLGTRADLAAVQEAAPAAVIVATGARPWVPTIPSLGDRLYDTVATFEAERIEGPTLVVGGSIAGLAVALAAGRRGGEVSLVEQSDTWGTGGGGMLTSRLIEELKALPNIVMHATTTVERIGGNSVEFRRKGKRWTVPAPAHLVFTRDMQAETSFADQCAQIEGMRTFRIGDCLWPRTMADATFEGASIAERLSLEV
jgi:2,4-dienoyl-CoA reductase-like NADH-dependent reductase (Old Yellow Enzyme family)/thioredoxin reductase